MNHHHRKILHALFAHPLNPNIHFKDLDGIFSELGASTGHSGNGRLKVELNGHTAAFHISQHEIPKEEVIQIRKFLETCGVDPEKDYPL